MSTDAAPLRRIVSPVITEKATHRVRAQSRSCSRSRSDATKPQIKAAVEKLFDVKVKAVNTLVRKGKTKAFRASAASRGREESDRDARRRPQIDVTTGL